jgi:hypothetical protein
MRHIRPHSGLCCGHDLSFQIASLPLGGGVPPRCLRESPRIVKTHRQDTPSRNFGWITAGRRARLGLRRSWGRPRLQQLHRVSDEPHSFSSAGDFQNALLVCQHDVLVAGPDNRIIIHLLPQAARARRDERRWQGSFGKENYETPVSLSRVNRIGLQKMFRNNRNDRLDRGQPDCIRIAASCR